MTRAKTNEYSTNMTRSELIAKWCADLKQEKVDEFDADLSSMLDEMIAHHRLDLNIYLNEIHYLRERIQSVELEKLILIDAMTKRNHVTSN